MKTQLRHLATLGAIGLALALTSCVSPYAGPNERDGAVIGAVGGGALGAMIGSHSGRPLEGAAIGGALGALAGSSIGASQDQRYRYGYGYSRPVYYRSGPRYGYSRYGYPSRYYGYRPYRSGFYASSYRFGPGYGYRPYYW